VSDNPLMPSQAARADERRDPVDDWRAARHPSGGAIHQTVLVGAVLSCAAVQSAANLVARVLLG